MFRQKWSRNQKGNRVSLLSGPDQIKQTETGVKIQYKTSFKTFQPELLSKDFLDAWMQHHVKELNSSMT